MMNTISGNSHWVQGVGGWQEGAAVSAYKVRTLPQGTPVSATCAEPGVSGAPQPCLPATLTLFQVPAPAAWGSPLVAGRGGPFPEEPHLPRGSVWRARRAALEAKCGANHHMFHVSVGSQLTDHMSATKPQCRTPLSCCGWIASAWAGKFVCPWRALVLQGYSMGGVG